MINKPTLDEIKSNLTDYNAFLRDKTYDEVIDWIFQISPNRIVTTSFGKYSAVLLSTFHRKDADIRVVWCDTGYNGPETYDHAEYLMNRFDLNVHRYTSLLPTEETDKLYFEASEVDSDAHEKFAEAVKIEPFRRALREENPDIWFTNIRERQTEYRDRQDKLSLSKNGILKVSPFYYWTDEQLDEYLEDKDLPRNDFYFDPVKALSTRECGIHLQ